MYELSLEDTITKDYVTIMRDKRFIAVAGIMMLGERKIVDGLPTAATNGRDVFFGREFMKSISNDAPLRRFVVLHEEYHKMFMHLSMYKAILKEDPQNANMAMDLVINITLDKQAGSKADGFIRVWEHACLDYAYDGMDTMTIYKKLRAQQQQQQQGKGQGQGKPGKPGQSGKGPSVRSAGGGKAQDFDNHEEGPAGSDPLSPEEVKEIQQQIDTALRQGAQMAGKMGGTMDRTINGLLEVSVSWEEQLQDWVRTTAVGNDLSTWRRPSRRWLSRDIYLPSHYTEAVQRIVISIDTSGSIGQAQLKRALTEIKGACDTVHPEFVDVIYWDSYVAGHEVYEGEAVATITEVTKPKGGGGTRVGCVLDYLKAKDIKPDCIIHFTDGYVESDWGSDNWPAPVLWCISTKGLTAPFGKSLYVPVD